MSYSQIKFNSGKEAYNYFVNLLKDIDRKDDPFDVENDETYVNHRERINNIAHDIYSFITDCPPNPNQDSVPDSWQGYLCDIYEVLRDYSYHKIDFKHCALIVKYSLEKLEELANN